MYPLKIKAYPPRLLLYSEWVMLGCCASLAVVETLENYLPIQHILILAVLSLMGLFKPADKTLAKMYILSQVILIFSGARLGYLHLLPMLYLIVVIRSCLMFKLPGRILTATLSFILFLLHQIQDVIIIHPTIQVQEHRFWMHQLSEVLMFALALLFLLQLTSSLIAEQKIRQQLSFAHAQLRDYIQHIEDLTAVQARNRTVSEIYDSLGHALTALNIQVQTTVKLWERDPQLAQSFLVQAQTLGTTVMKEVRKSVQILREDARLEQPLEVAIASLVEAHRQASSVLISTHIHLINHLPSHIVKLVYQIVQQALNNCKYAQATQVKIQLNTDPNKVSLRIEDNAKGLDCQSNIARFELQNMRGRVTEISGNFQLETTNCSSQIIVELPLPKLPE